MVCALMLWVVGLYFGVQWLRYSLRPLDYEHAPLWLSTPRYQIGR